MSEMGSHDPFEYFKHKLWPKEGLRVKLPISFSTIKSRESPRFPYVQVACKWCATHHWKALHEGYNFTLNLISIGGQHAKLWAPEDMGIPLGSLKTKYHLGAGLMARHKVYYKGEGRGCPQVQAMLSLVNPSLLVAHPITKNA
jgi:hypothetical protein